MLPLQPALWIKPWKPAMLTNPECRGSGMPSYVCQNLNLFLSKWCSTRKMGTQDSTFILYEHTEAKMQEELPLHWDFEMLNLESIDINSIYNNFYCTIKKQNALKSYTFW